MLESRGFFLDAGVGDVEGLIAIVYDLAYFWKADPAKMMSMPLDEIFESLGQAVRINETLKGA